MGTKKISEIIINLVLFMFGILLFISAQSIEAGAAMGQGGDFMPKLCSAIWVLISGLMLAISVFNKQKQNIGIKENIKGFFLTLVLLFFYIFLMKPIGFVISSIFYMFAQMMLFVPKELINKRRLILFAVISIVLPILVNLLFVNVFSLILPTGILE